jgi:arylformamidase
MGVPMSWLQALGLPFKDVVDLTMPIKSLETPVFPGYPMPVRATLTTIREQGYYSSLWTFVEHTATHMDAPAHFAEGAPYIDKVPLSTCLCRGVVLDFSDVGPNYSIRRQDIERRLAKLGKQDKVGPGWAVLIYTGYSAKAGTPEWMQHPELSEDACNYLAGLRVAAVGIDAPSPDHAPFPAHRILLPKGIVLLENLTNLERLVGKEFVLIAAPLVLANGSASPMRALALLL